MMIKETRIKTTEVTSSEKHAPLPQKKVKKRSTDHKNTDQSERLLIHRQIGFGGHLQGKHSTDWVSKPRSSCAQLNETLREIKDNPIDSKCLRQT